MSVVINTNHAATLASANLASSSASLQRSLNRLSSGSKIVNPQDDAAGLAVSMKLTATARRQEAASTNIGNAVSFLQTQDGALSVAGKVLERIGELKTLYSDPTKNSDDLANYQAEFSQLQTQLTSLGNETFNGVSLFGTAGLSLAVTAEGTSGAVVEFGAADLLEGPSSPAFATFTDTFNNLANWTNTGTGNTTATTASNYLTLTTNNPSGSGDAEVTSNASYSGALEITLDFTPNGPFEVDIGGTNVFSHSSGSTSSLRIVVDDSGNYSSYINGSSTAYSSGSGISGSNQITLRHLRQASTSSNVHIQNFSISSTSSGGSDVYGITQASSLAAVDLSDVTGALQEVATYRAGNGAEQSRLQFASEVLTVNQANIEAANSRLSDVDVAQESTALARYNILVQSGTAMLSQANQSAQNALRLLG